MSRSHFLDRSLERARLIVAHTVPRPQRCSQIPSMKATLAVGPDNIATASGTPTILVTAPPPPRPRTTLLSRHPQPPPTTPAVQPPLRRRLRLGPDTRTLTQMARGDPPKPKPKPGRAPRPRHHPYRCGHHHPTTLPHRSRESHYADQHTLVAALGWWEINLPML